ncbi:MAG: hypothetical protein ACRBCT_04270 [Alphaproteobacteria bacterium]
MIPLLPLLLLSACAVQPTTLETYLSKRSLSLPEKGSFQTCRHYGCQIIDTITPTKKEWRSIEKPFKKRIKSAQAERQAIAQSIATFETVTGNYNGTHADQWGTFQKTGHDQQDCVDESINTSIYLTILANRNRLKFHTVNIPQSRVPFMKWPHQTATITQIDTNEKFAVDSWFHDNGHAPEIIPFEEWKKGWKPKRD